MRSELGSVGVGEIGVGAIPLVGILVFFFFLRLGMMWIRERTRAAKRNCANLDYTMKWTGWGFACYWRKRLSLIMESYEDTRRF